MSGVIVRGPVDVTVERYDEVPRHFAAVSIERRDDMIIIERQFKTLAWYPADSVSAVLFGAFA